MAFKPISTNATDIKKHPNKPFVGEFKGSTEITTKIGKQIVWNFVEESGAPLGIYGFTNLNRVMEHIQEGTVCRITYKGTENVKTKFGMKDVHQVLVEIDDEEYPPQQSRVNSIAEKILTPEELAGNSNNDDLPF